jgi:predicted Zn-ribbon and HTH transcriptional regulator
MSSVIEYGITKIGRGAMPIAPDSFLTPLASLFAARIAGKHKKDVLMLLVGERGSGKSYTLLYLALRCAEEVAKRLGGKPEDYFTFKNVAVIQDEDLENRMQNLRKHNIYILDDAGVGWDSRAFASTMNRRLNHILQTCRTDNCILLISVIDPFTIDKVPRTMVRYYAEIAEQLHDYGKNMVKVFRNKRLYREGKNLTPHLRFGHRTTVRRWLAGAPSPELADEYDRVRDENAKKIKEQMAKAGVRPDVVCIHPIRILRCNDCGYEFEAKVKNPKRCPGCTKRGKGFTEISSSM